VDSKSDPIALPSNLGAGEDLIEDFEVQEPPEDNTAHPELSNLRDALTTSLASPGGVELDESPLHNGVSNPDVVEDERADFPSEGPTTSNKHFSTMSFARTVSGGVDFGEDDEVDPEWNIQRTDTDPFKSMAPSDRTNSFPQVPAAHAPRITHDEPLPHSQAEDIMHEVDQEPRDLFGDEGNDGDADFFAQAVTADGVDDYLPESQYESNIGELDSNNYGQSYGGDVRQEEDEESQARYEEGLPLVQPPEDQDVEQASSSNHHFMDDDGIEEDDFFAQVGKSDQPPEESFPEPHPIERKSTMQVMDSLSFKTHEQTQDLIEEEDMGGSQSSLERSTGGAIGVSTSTVLSQVLGDPEAPILSQPANLAGLELDSGEGDLAAKWKAALAGDEFLDDDDDLLLDDEEQAENAAKMELNPAELFGSDDEGFLEDTDDQNLPTDFSQQISPPIPASITSPNGHVMGFDNLTGVVQQNQPTRPGSSSSRYLPTGATTVAPASTNSFAPAAPLFTDLSRPIAQPSVPSPYASPAMSNFSLQQEQRREMPKAQSFADKAKGGYSSPYDLPMEVVKPRKRQSAQQLNRGYNATQPTAAPPRSSSMHSQPPMPSNVSTSSLSPPQSSHSQQGQPQQPAAQAQPPKTVRKTQSGFFEDLPMASKPKLAARHSAAQPQNPYTPPSSAQAQQNFPPSAQSPYAQPPPQAAPPGPPHGLVAPERVNPYGSLPTSKMTVPPVQASRYSPSPLQQRGQNAPLPPVAQSRYSPAPPSQREVPSYSTPPLGASPSVLAHQPRTSSPLAHFERSQDARSYSAPAETASFDRRSSSSGYESTLKPTHLPPTREVDEDEQAAGMQNQYAQQPPQSIRPITHTPPPQSLISRIGRSPPKSSPPKRRTSNYLPEQPSNQPPAFVPPQRSQTQSPGTAFAGPRLEMSTAPPYQRPASVELPPSPRTNVGYPSMTTTIASRPRGFSQGVNYIAPTDGRENDPLQRWRGAPVFAWGVGGTIITSFPQDVPRYGMGQTQPMIIRSPGEVKIQNIKDVDPLPERLTSFPGPLKGKSKKKDVVTWLTSSIQILEQEAAHLRSLSTLSHEDKRTEERILLWKILRVFIENDGLLEGNPAVEKAVRNVLSPGLDEEASSAAPLYATGAELSGISQSPSSGLRSDPVDPASVDQLRTHLLRGEREKAVWEAVDKRLWAHAMLISNTVSRELYKQVAQEFVQKEVKNIGDNTESLAALYEIFAGNFEESIDELVPPSARAGFQMVSTSKTSGTSKDALEGLDRWRETLGLVLSNRSTDDSQALNALGKLLSGYGRAEAAHICYLFARSHTVFGGIDDPATIVVLIGADQLRQPYEFDKEMEPILLSEVFEYGMSLSSVSTIPISSPHLSVYKLQHATILAEYGYREKALQYCEAIASSITSQTRRSPYHHGLLIAALDDLTKRLKQSPKDDSASWISKPSIDKVSSSVWTTFNKFVAGDENDAAASGPNSENAAEVGPFARIAGGTPTISRSPSHSDLYGSYNDGLGINGSIPPLTKTSSRYAPGGAYTPSSHEQSQSHGSQPRSALEGRSSGEHGRYEPQQQMSGMSSDYRPTSQPTNNYAPQTSSSYTPQSSYTPFSDTSSPYAPQVSTPVTEQPPSNIYSSPQPLSFDGQQQLSAYTPSDPSYSRQTSSSYEPPTSSFEQSASSGYEPPTTSSSYEPPSSGGYEPPLSGYEPPSYEPATMNDEPDSPVETRPKKSFMDDDEDDIPALKAVPAAREKTKAEKDREADEAFRKAAEEDGKHPHPKSPLHLTNIAQQNEQVLQLL
jgi:hypothetical protein